MRGSVPVADKVVPLVLGTMIYNVRKSFIADKTTIGSRMSPIHEVLLPENS